jgi:hypothetical protein
MIQGQAALDNLEAGRVHVPRRIRGSRLNAYHPSPQWQVFHPEHPIAFHQAHQFVRYGIGVNDSRRQRGGRFSIRSNDQILHSNGETVEFWERSSVNSDPALRLHRDLTGDQADPSTCDQDYDGHSACLAPKKISVLKLPQTIKEIIARWPYWA